MRQFISAIAIATLIGSGSVAFAQNSGTKEETKKAVQHTYACVDGTTDEATLKANACKDHGGVKVEAKVKS